MAGPRHVRSVHPIHYYETRNRFVASSARASWTAWVAMERRRAADRRQGDRRNGERRSIARRDDPLTAGPVGIEAMVRFATEDEVTPDWF